MQYDHTTSSSGQYQTPGCTLVLFEAGKRFLEVIFSYPLDRAPKHLKLILTELQGHQISMNVILIVNNMVKVTD